MIEIDVTIRLASKAAEAALADQLKQHLQSFLVDQLEIADVVTGSQLLHDDISVDGTINHFDEGAWHEQFR